MTENNPSHPNGPNFNADRAGSAVSRRQILRTAGVLVAGGFAAGGWSAADAATKKKTPLKRSTSATTKAASATQTTRALTPAANCSVIPQETGGPFPGDGTNGANVLTQPGIVRSDVRSSFGKSTTLAKGVLLKLRLTVNSTATCGAFAGAAVYIWHCDQGGNYSLYSEAVLNENYLRGVQVAAADGTLEFTTIFPAAYPGRWPHIHFEIYPTLARATTGANAIGTSQLAFPEATCRQVYATSGYEASVANMSRTQLANDRVFSDGVTKQTPTISGSLASGLAAALTISVDP